MYGELPNLLTYPSLIEPKAILSIEIRNINRVHSLCSLFMILNECYELIHVVWLENI